MSPKKKRGLITVLFILVVLTIAVYSAPKLSVNLPTSELLSKISFFGNWANSEEPIIRFFKKIVQQENKSITTKTSLRGMVDWPLLSYWEWTVLSWSIELKTDHIITYSAFQEEIHYQIDWISDVLSWGEVLYSTLFNAHWDSISYDNKSYFKMAEQDLIQEWTSSPTVLLWQSLLNHYKNTRLSTEKKLSLTDGIQTTIHSVRYLETSKEETYLELEWSLVKFTWTLNDESKTFSWSFTIPWTQIEWTIRSTEKKGEYELTLSNENKYKAAFDWIVQIWREKNPSMSINWSIRRPAWISLEVSVFIDPTAMSSIKKKTPPKKSIPWKTIQDDLLGL